MNIIRYDRIVKRCRERLPTTFTKYVLLRPKYREGSTPLRLSSCRKNFQPKAVCWKLTCVQVLFIHSTQEANDDVHSTKMAPVHPTDPFFRAGSPSLWRFLK